MTGFFESTFFQPQVEFIHAECPPPPRKVARWASGSVARAWTLAAAAFLSLNASRFVVSDSAQAQEALAQTAWYETALSTSIAELRSEMDLAAIHQRAPLNRSESLRELARAATASLASRQNEDIETWARALATDVTNAND